MKKFISILLAVLIVAAMFAMSMVSTFAAEPTGSVIDDDMNRGGVTALNDNDVLDNANDDDMNGGGTINDGQTNGNDNVTDNTASDNKTDNVGTDTDVITDTKSDTVTPENPTEVVTAEDATVIANPTETVTTTASAKSATATPTEKSSNINNPKTGDTILYVGIALAVAAACFVVMQLHARKKRSEM